MLGTYEEMHTWHGSLSVNTRRQGMQVPSCTITHMLNSWTPWHNLQAHGKCIEIESGLGS